MARSQITLHDNMTPTQVEILRTKCHFLLISGPAGTGKSFIALARGLHLLHRREVDNITIIRSAVPTRNLGFLPGDDAEKVDVYAAPYIGLIDQLSPRMKFREMVSKKMISFESTSYLRGMTFDNTYMMIDEYQNMSGHELETALTRVGDETHLVLCGDSEQSDLRGAEAEEHREVIKTLTRMEEFEAYAFGVEDIVRSDFVRSYYKAKQEAQRPPVAGWA